MEKKIKIGEIIWAKVRGFPWWPGRIGKIEETDCLNQHTKILVNFIGDSTHAEIPITKIEKFEGKLEEFSRTKKKNLINAINMAKKLIRDENNTNNIENYGNFKKPSDKNSSKRNDTKESNSSEEINKEIKIKFLNKKRLLKTKLINKENKGEINADHKKRKLNSKYINLDSNERLKNGKLTRINPKENKLKKEKILREKNDNNQSYSEDNSDEDSSSSHERSSEDEKHISEDSESPSTELMEKIHELVFSKIEMPSATSNKSILSSLEHIESLLDKIDKDQIYDLTRDLFPFLSCLFRNKNSEITAKAFSLSNALQAAIIDNIFFSFEKISTMNFSDKKQDVNELDACLTLYLEDNKENKTHKKTEPNKKSRRIISKLDLHKKEFNMKQNISYKLFKSNLFPLEEELQTMSEDLSLDSHKTDCEDKDNRSNFKIQITPLDKSSLRRILEDYFSLCEMQTDCEFFCKLFKGEIFNCQEKTTVSRPIKNHYMRRRVCYKLYKVFEKLLSKEDIDNKFIKELSIYLEQKARESDSEMNDKYKLFISNLFNKIKAELLLLNVPKIETEENYS